MIVCSCNVLSDEDVRAAVTSAEDAMRHAKHVYTCLGCNVECGRCMRSVKAIIEEALGDCAQRCHSGCGHRGAAPQPAANDAERQPEFALAAC